MGWVNDSLTALRAGKPVTIRPHGGSMRGRIESGQLVTLVPARDQAVAAGDAVLVRWKGNWLLHLVKAVRGDELLIGNTLGKDNGWVPRDAVVGVVTSVTD